MTSNNFNNFNNFNDFSAINSFKSINGLIAANGFSAIFKRDLQLFAKRPGESIRPLLYFFMIACIFPIVLPVSPTRLSELAAPILWVAAALAMLISFETHLREDFIDGSFEQLLLAKTPLAMLLLAKLLAHWVMVVLPLVLMAPLLAVILNLPNRGFIGLELTLLLGLPTLSLVTAMAVSLILGLVQGNLLLALLVLPLVTPVLLFGSSGTIAASCGLPYVAELALLGALLLIFLILAPFTMAFCVRNSVQ